MNQVDIPLLDIEAQDIDPAEIHSAAINNKRDTFWRLYACSPTQKSRIFAAPGASKEEYERANYENLRDRTSGEIGFFSLRNITFRNSGYIFKDNQLLAHPAVMLPYVAGLTKEGRRSDVTDPGELSLQEIKTPVAIITAEAPQIYGHWLLDYLPRLWLLKKFWKGPTLRILLPNTAPDWALNIMKTYFRIPESEFLLFDPNNTSLNIEHAVVPSFLHCGHEFHPLMNSFVDDVVSICTQDQPHPLTGSRIYISRHLQRHASHSWQRYIRNEADILRLAQDCGYTVVCPEQLSWHDQVRVFSAARSIVGEEGSAMHNSLFASLGTSVATLPHGSHVQVSLSALRQHPTTSLPASNAREEFDSLSYEVDPYRAKQLFLDLSDKSIK